MERKIKVTVIGGANADICGASFNTPVVSDSNPGRVTVSSGGVGRNIAHNLCLLGADVDFLSAFGGGELSRSLVNECRSLGMELEGSVFDETLPCSSYLCVNDNSGELVIAVNDMDVLNALTPEVITCRADSISSSDAVVFDTNLSQETVEFICSFCKVPLFCDTVSTIKAPRVAPFLSSLFAIKANRAEAELLTGEKDVKKAAEVLCGLGVKNSFVSCGAEGMVYCTRSGESGRVNAAANDIVSTSGAGDAAMAAIVFALSHGRSVETAAEFAMRASAMACAGSATVNPCIGNLASIITG